MAAFTENELEFLRSVRLLGRIATVDPAGNVHVTPVGWSLGADEASIEIGGKDFARTKKYRDVARTGKAAIVIDEVLEPWRPRGIEIRGTAEAVGGERPFVRITATRVVAWGIDGEGRNARSVAPP